MAEHTEWNPTRSQVKEIVAQRDELLAEVSRLQQEVESLLAALFVFGIEPPENDGEEWIRISDDGGEPAGETAVVAATEAHRVLWGALEKAEAELSALRSAPPSQPSEVVIPDDLTTRWLDTVNKGKQAKRRDGTPYRYEGMTSAEAIVEWWEKDIRPTLSAPPSGIPKEEKP